MSTPIPAVVYVRISLDRSGEGLAVERQEQDALRLAAVRGWDVVEVITDNSISASGKRKREGFERLLQVVESGQAQVVVSWSLDRLTRNRADTLRLVETCQKAHALIALCRGSDMDMATPAGRMTADILAAVARGEIEVKSDRQSRAARQAAEQGRHVKGRRPFGFEDDGVTVRESEAAWVRWGFRAILDGLSLREVARQWNEAGLTTPQQGNQWTGPVVSRTLRLPRMAGLRAYRKTLLLVDGQPVVGNWPALVDVETWEAAQWLMTNPSRRSATGGQRLLTGVAVCGVCSAGVHSGGARDGFPRYRCGAGGGHVNRRADPVDEYVQAAILARLARPDFTALWAGDDRGGDADDLRRELRLARQRHDELPGLFTDGVLTAAELAEQRHRLRERIIELEQRLPGQRSQVLSRLADGDTTALWESLSVETRRQVIDSLATVTLHPPGRGVTTVSADHVVLTWR